MTTRGTWTQERPLAIGGRSIVSLARGTDGRVAVLKTLRVDTPDRRRRFEAEADALAALVGTTAPRLFDKGIDGDEGWLALEWIGGPTLEHVLAGRAVIAGATAPEGSEAALRRQMLRVAAKLADGVAAIHARGFLHLDIKASNVLLPAALDPRLVDFGAAQRLDVRDAPSDTRTLACCAPEQIDPSIGPLSASTDVFALGMLIVRMVAGVEARPRPDLFLRRPRAPFRPPEELRRRLGPPLLAVVWKCLETSPARRYVDAAALADDLKRLLRDDVPSVRIPSPWRRFAEHPVARPGLFAAAFAGVVVLSIAVGRSLLPDTRRVTIDALHRGGTLTFDDGSHVVLPVRGLPLAPGRHAVRYAPHDGSFAPLDTTLDVPDDAPNVFRLLPTIPPGGRDGPHGLIGVEAADGAAIYVDDVPLPPSKGPRRPPIPVAPGKYRLRAVSGDAVESIVVDVPAAAFVPVVLLPKATVGLPGDFRATWGNVLAPLPAALTFAADPGVGTFVNEFREPTLLREGRLGPRTCVSVLDPDGRERTATLVVDFPEPMRSCRLAMTIGPGSPTPAGSSEEDFAIDGGPWRPLPPRDLTDGLTPELEAKDGMRRLAVRVRMRASVLGPGWSVVECFSSGFDAGPNGQLAFAIVATRKGR